MGVFEKSKEKILNNIRFCQIKFTNFLIFKSLRMVKNQLKFSKVRLKLQNFPRVLQNYLIFSTFKMLKLIKYPLQKCKFLFFRY